MMAADDEEEDLYGDLTDSTFAAKTSRPSLDSQQVQELQQELDKLKQENETLKRNMGTLFRTARAEIKRKDAKIESLMEQLDQKASAPS
jgi:predicted RNase H-like nuclease (RuvC/YqgF family)